MHNLRFVDFSNVSVSDTIEDTIEDMSGNHQSNEKTAMEEADDSSTDILIITAVDSADISDTSMIEDSTNAYLQDNFELNTITTTSTIVTDTADTVNDYSEAATGLDVVELQQIGVGTSNKNRYSAGLGSSKAILGRRLSGLPNMVSFNIKSYDDSTIEALKVIISKFPVTPKTVPQVATNPYHMSSIKTTAMNAVMSGWGSFKTVFTRKK